MSSFKSVVHLAAFANIDEDFLLIPSHHSSRIILWESVSVEELSLMWLPVVSTGVIVATDETAFITITWTLKNLTKQKHIIQIRQ